MMLSNCYKRKHLKVGLTINQRLYWNKVSVPEFTKIK